MVSSVPGQGSIYPESGGAHGNVQDSGLPAQEAAFHQWNDALTQNYNAAYPKPQFQDPPNTQAPRASMSRYPLYRTSQQNPDDVFQPGGKLQSRTAAVNPNHPRRTWDLSRHQVGLPSHYTSMTTSLPAAQDLSTAFRGNHVFVTDPQPHGRYMNHQSSAGEGPHGNTGNALADAAPFRGTEQALAQHEVAVPGNVPTSDVRGAVPVDPSTGQLDFAGLKKNPYYEPPASSGNRSDLLSQQVLQDSGLSHPLRRL